MEEKEEKIEVKVGPIAYKKIIYHLVRYPTAKVTGIHRSTQAFSPGQQTTKWTTHIPCSTHLSSTLPSAWLST